MIDNKKEQERVSVPMMPSTKSSMKPSSSEKAMPDGVVPSVASTANTVGGKLVVITATIAIESKIFFILTYPINDVFQSSVLFWHSI